VSLFALLTHPAIAQTTRASVPYDSSTPLKASASLARAAAAHDQYAVTITYHASTDDERALLSAMDSAGRAAADLHDACLARFNQGLPEPEREDTGDADEAEVNGDEAFVYVGGKQSGLRVRWVRVRGQWKIPMSDVLRVQRRIHKSLERAIGEKRDWAKQVRQVAKEVRAGRYASPEEVETRLGELASAADSTANAADAKAAD
jgi:hypothetical protein